MVIYIYMYIGALRAAERAPTRRLYLVRAETRVQLRLGPIRPRSCQLVSTETARARRVHVHHLRPQPGPPDSHLTAESTRKSLKEI